MRNSPGAAVPPSSNIAGPWRWPSQGKIRRRPPQTSSGGIRRQQAGSAAPASSGGIHPGGSGSASGSSTTGAPAPRWASTSPPLLHPPLQVFTRRRLGRRPAVLTLPPRVSSLEGICHQQTSSFPGGIRCRRTSSAARDLDGSPSSASFIATAPPPTPGRPLAFSPPLSRFLCLCGC